MKIKSLLLGSAAGLFAVSGAQAADAIVAAAPEPVEYVRVCDAFGTGYFYIPGTETCLRIGGYVRHDMSGGELLGADVDGDGEGDSWSQNTRLSLQTWTATDTELGVLSTFTESRFDYNNFGNTFETGRQTDLLNKAWIQLGGLRIGKDDSAFTTWTGYAGAVINDTTPVSYGPFDSQLISYTLDAGNGFSAIVSLEDDLGVHDANITAEDGYIPDVVAGLKYEAGAFAVSVVGGLDESIEEGAVKARLDADFGGFSAFIMGGYSTNGDNQPGNISGSNRYATWGGDWAVWGGGSAPVTDMVTFNTQIHYDEEENFGALANLKFAVTSGFSVTTEVGYADNFDDAVVDDGNWGGTIRFQRDF